MDSKSANRIRLVAVICFITVVMLGLYARSQRPDAESTTWIGFLATYAGDTLWPVAFCLFGRFLNPGTNGKLLVIGVLALTLVIEFGQLWNPPILQWLRGQPGIGFMLGNSFLWSDVACLLVGSILAFFLDMLLTTACGVK